MKINKLIVFISCIFMLIGVAYAADTSFANPPDLYDGALKPIMFDANNETVILTVDGSGKVVDSEGNQADWYNYDEKRWANAVTVDDEGNITGYYVWIPRFAYSINSGYHSQYVGIKKILFLEGGTNKDKYGKYHSSFYEDVEYIGDRQLKYLVHPAFSFGGNITGFWMAKFEASEAENGDLRFLPGVAAIRNTTSDKTAVTIGYAFDRSMGLKDECGFLEEQKADTHLVKNIEWGAMASLTSSKYGKESEEVWINNYYPKENKVSNTRTGYGSNKSNSAVFTTKSTEAVDYKTEVGGKIQQSTTGNVYGIYDTSGGVWEFVAGHINARDYYDNVLNTDIENVVKSYGANLYETSYKYKDLYPMSESNGDNDNYNLSSVRKGDGIWETSSSGYTNVSQYLPSWYNDNSAMPNGRYPFFVRGGSYNLQEKAGIYSFMPSNGAKHVATGFRVIIAKSL